ncbi:MAG: restriction endonuclease subunit S, partial [Sodaliphilus sp.]|nr:restriction endonuclease subunit S [Sodaliphilus sp.]
MEWKLSELSVDGKGHYGIGAPAIPYDKNKPTYLRITDINDDGTINFLDLKSVDDEDSNKYLLKENDIVFARTGNSTGRSYFYQKEHGDFVYAGFLIKFSIDPQKVNPKILKYYTHSQEYYNWVKSFDTGGTRGNINAKTFGDMPISLPKRCVQDKIVGILSALDSKIENNNKINANLEAQAQALFKSWFVDFTPFKDQPFVDSELGPIPQGWKVVSLDDMTSKVGTGLNPRKNFTLGQGSNYYVTIKNMYNNRVYLDSRCDKITDEAIQKIQKRSKLQVGDLLFSGIGTIGRVALINKSPYNWNTSESVFNLHPSEEISSEFLY